MRMLRGILIYSSFCFVQKIPILVAPLSFRPLLPVRVLVRGVKIQSGNYGATNNNACRLFMSTNKRTNEKYKVKPVSNFNSSHDNEDDDDDLVQGESESSSPPLENRDEMIARAAVLRQDILKKNIELQRLERRILCCTTSTTLTLTPSSSLLVSEEEEIGGWDAINSFGILNDPLDYLVRTNQQATATFKKSADMFRRKLDRVRAKIGKNNQKYNSVEHYVASQTFSGARILGDLALNPDRLMHLADPNTPSLMPHLPAIYARLDKLEVHVRPILEKVLNNKQHLNSIEPYLDEVLERFDDIEPHFPWILANVDTLAPYTGLLLKHIDELLLYAEGDDYDADVDVGGDTDTDSDEQERYALAEQLLPYLEFYVSRLDTVGPHLPLLRPHIPKLLKHNRIAKITPHLDRLFARGYLSLGTSANLDVLLFWVGWTLNVPLLPRIFFAMPGSPRFVTVSCRRAVWYLSSHCYYYYCLQIMVGLGLVGLAHRRFISAF